MKPESSHSSISTQKFALALSRDWVTNAYNDVTAKNRMKIPYEIEINVDTFNDKSTDGQNENELIEKFNSQIDSEKEQTLSNYFPSLFDKFLLYGGIAIGVIGLMMIFGNIFLGLIAIIAGIVMVLKHKSNIENIETNRKKIEEQYENKRVNGEQIIRATLAEIVDFRIEFAERDAESTKVLDFLEQIRPEQYVNKLASSNRKIKI
ncbi:glycerol-3-phosphate acyltransferase [Streptococcus oralis]|nr:glycerol-3-phosphate acyltransferase [Streptococcus oralis]